MEKKHINSNPKKQKNVNSFFLPLIVIITLFFGIGYAQIAGIDLSITGTASAGTINDVIITNITYLSSNGVDQTKCSADYPYLTLMNSHIELGSDLSSSISYKVKIKNRSDSTVTYLDAIYSETVGYDNQDIVFTVEGISEGDKLAPNEEKEVIVTFKYADDLSAVTNNVLNAVINFKFDDGVYDFSKDIAHFDGTTNSVINTGIYLYSEENVNRNFRITFTIDDYDASYDNPRSSSQETIFNCKNEAVTSVWPGIMMRLGKSGTATKYEFGIRDSHITTTYKQYNMESGVKVSVVRENGKIYMNWNTRKHSLVYTYADQIDTFDVPLTFGGIINASGEYERLFKGTLSDITVMLYDGDKLEEFDNIESKYTETRGEDFYRLDGTIVFDGTNYVDTGLNLFSPENINKDFDISFTLDDIGPNSNQNTLVNAKNEGDSTYPGFAYRYESGKMKMTARWPSQTAVSNIDPSNTLPRDIKIYRRDGIIYYQIGSNAETTFIDASSGTLSKPFNVNLTFGASINSSGNPFRYFNGIVSNISVQLSDSE